VVFEEKYKGIKIPDEMLEVTTWKVH
jgi:hypothetical protein